MSIPHLPVYICPGHQGGHAVHNHDADSPAADKGVCNLQGLLSGVRLGNKLVINVYAQLSGIERVQGMLGVYEGGNPAGVLHRGDNVQ